MGSFNTLIVLTPEGTNLNNNLKHDLCVNDIARTGTSSHHLYIYPDEKDGADGEAEPSWI